MLYQDYFLSPIGWVEIMANDTYIISCRFVDLPSAAKTNQITSAALHELENYFAGKLKTFASPLLMDGTVFQKTIWGHLSAIPYGKTVSYSHIANLMGDINKVRAIGNANSKNMILIFLPCHRVIGHNGTLVGYAGELWRKKWLIHHEAMHTGSYQTQLMF